MSFDRQASAARVADLVRASGAHLGAVIDPGGEHVVIVDDKGHTLTDDEALLVLLQLITQTYPHARVALPVAVSRAAEKICSEAGAEIIWTKLSASHLMEVAATEHVTFAASQTGGFIFPHFLPGYDAAATLVNLVAMLTKTRQRLSTMVNSLPRVHIAHNSVHTPWEQKGMLMRTLVERLSGRNLILVDGVKVLEEDGWALVLPDPEEPVTHVWAEGPSEAEAGARAQEYSVRLRQLLR
jgi:mannose-1-phosphate guanylyltransferase / phosphomannomutase